MSVLGASRRKVPPGMTAGKTVLRCATMKPTPIRIPDDLVARIDAVIARMAKQPGASADPPTRSKVIRLALVAGLPALEKRR